MIESTTYPPSTLTTASAASWSKVYKGLTIYTSSLIQPCICGYAQIGRMAQLPGAGFTVGIRHDQTLKMGHRKPEERTGESTWFTCCTQTPWEELSEGDKLQSRYSPRCGKRKTAERS